MKNQTVRLTVEIPKKMMAWIDKKRAADWKNPSRKFVVTEIIEQAMEEEKNG